MPNRETIWDWLIVAVVVLVLVAIVGVMAGGCL